MEGLYRDRFSGRHSQRRGGARWCRHGAAEPEYELRAFPGPGMGPGVELLTATMGHYQQITGRQRWRVRG